MSVFSKTFECASLIDPRCSPLAYPHRLNHRAFDSSIKRPGQAACKGALGEAVYVTGIKKAYQTGMMQAVVMQAGPSWHKAEGVGFLIMVDAVSNR